MAALLPNMLLTHSAEERGHPSLRGCVCQNGPHGLSQSGSPQPDIVAYTYNPTAQEAEAGELM